MSNFQTSTKDYLDKSKIVYEEAIISRDSVEKINFDERYIDINGKRINSDQLQISVIFQKE